MTTIAQPTGPRMTYKVVDAQGWYGDYTRIYGVFETLEEADAAARKRGYRSSPCAVVDVSGAVGHRVHRADAERGQRIVDAERAKGENR